MCNPAPLDLNRLAARCLPKSPRHTYAFPLPPAPCHPCARCSATADPSPQEQLRLRRWLQHQTRTKLKPTIPSDLRTAREGWKLPFTLPEIHPRENLQSLLRFPQFYSLIWLALETEKSIRILQSIYNSILTLFSHHLETFLGLVC